MSKNKANKTSNKGITGSVNQRIPVRYLQEISAESKSLDLMKNLESFTMMALNYKHKSKVENKVLILQRLINEAAIQQVNAKGENLRDTEGNLYQVTEGETNLNKMVDHTV